VDDMQGIIAVEKTLSRLADILETKGYEVVDLSESDLVGVDAIVVGGTDINVLNIQDTVTDVPVINATGKTFNEIIEELGRM
jgi:aspartate/glutamate racemase